MPISENLRNNVIKKIEQKEANIEYYKQQILIVDAEKEEYDNGIKSLDNDLLLKVENVNNKINDVTKAYQNRVDSGCYSDLFWRVDSIGVGIPTVYNLIVDQLSLAGYGTTVSYVDGSGGITTYPANSTFGFQSDNLHGLVYKDQPYLKDIGDTTITSFVGAISVGSTVLTVISNDDTGIRSDLSVGNVIIASKNTVFSGGSNTIVGFGTTVFNSTYIETITGIATTSILTTTIILGVAAIGIASVPESDGSYVTFTGVVDPQEFTDQKPRFRYSIPFTKNPFSPETIGVLDRSTVGIGYTIEYDNSGAPANSQSWKPEFDGVKIKGNTVSEPSVGAGKTYYRVGFTQYPTDAFGNPASKGATRSTTLLTSLYSNTPSCSAGIAASLTNAISARDAVEADFSSNYSSFQTILSTNNFLREERNEYSLRIWTMRQSIGGENEKIDTYEQMKEYLGFSTVTGVLG